MGISTVNRTSGTIAPTDTAARAVERSGALFGRVAVLKIRRSAGAVGTCDHVRSIDLTRSVKVSTVTA